MKTNSRTTRTGARRGMTLIELTVVLLVAMTLMTLLFIGARGWKRGSDRAVCILNIRQMQQAVRNYAASHQYYPGQDVSDDVPGGSLYKELVGVGNYLVDHPVCPADGEYDHDGNVIPEVGHLYLRCSLGVLDQHRPETNEGW